MKFDFDKIIEGALVPMIGGIFILYGAVNVMSFYHNFNVNILPYLDFSELITYFLNDAVLLIFYVLSIIGLSKLSNYLELEIKRLDMDLAASIKDIEDLKQTAEKDGELIKSNILGKLLKQFNRPKKRSNKPIFIFVLVTVLLTVLFFKVEEFPLFTWITGTFFMSLAIIIFSPNLRKYVFLVSPIFILVAGYNIANQKALKIKNGANYGIRFSINNHIFPSDSCDYTSYYIGKTSRYLFFYDNLKKKTIVYPSEPIEWVEFPENKMTGFGFFVEDMNDIMRF